MINLSMQADLIKAPSVSNPPKKWGRDPEIKVTVITPFIYTEQHYPLLAFLSFAISDLVLLLAL